MRILLLLTLFAYIAVANAQNITLTGKVTEANTGNALANVVVSIRPEGANKILKFCTTKADGTFSLTLSSLPEGNTLFRHNGLCPKHFAPYCRSHGVRYISERKSYRAQGRKH